jgi:hypothetical protein
MTPRLIPGVILMTMFAPLLGRISPFRPTAGEPALAALLATLVLLPAALRTIVRPSPDLWAIASFLAAAVISGAAGGLAGWPAPGTVPWMLAAASWAAAAAAVSSVRVRTRGKPPITSAISLPFGVIVDGPATAVAWVDPDGAVRTTRVRYAILAPIALALHALVVPVVQGRKPRLLNLRRLHGAEHVAVLHACAGKELDTDALRGLSPITPHCGGTVVMIFLPLLFAAVPAAGPAQTAATLWAIFCALCLRNAAIELPMFAPLLAPGLLLQRVTTAPPSEIELAVATAACKAALDRQTEVRP